MNKRLLLCLSATLIALLAPAQSFNKLWKQYDAARRADRPRTALTVAREVARKALDEGNNGQLVKALFAEAKQKDSTPLRNRVKEYLGGHGTYYRYLHGERPLMPEQQEWILNLFRRNGYTEDLCFDGYREIYDFVSD